jgi:hypothetical protein
MEHWPRVLMNDIIKPSENIKNITPHEPTFAEAVTL